MGGAVDPRVKHARTNQMLRLSERKWEAFASRFVGDTRPVLLEHPQGHGKPMAGHTDN